jgi:hypothetical protein
MQVPGVQLLVPLLQTLQPPTDPPIHVLHVLLLCM